MHPKKTCKEDNGSSSGLVGPTTSSMQEQDDDPQSSPLPTSYNPHSETQDQNDSIQILSQPGLQESTVEKTPTTPGRLPPTATPAGPSPFKTPHRLVNQPVEKKMRMKKAALFPESSGEAEVVAEVAQSSSRQSQTSWSLSDGTPERVFELLRSVSQNQEESPAPALNFRAPSELLLDQDMSQADGLMSNVEYCITGKIHEKVKELLKHAKAKHTNYPAETNTHLLMGSDPDVAMVESAKALNEDVCSVNEEWVMLSCLVGQLLPITPFSGDKLLSDVVACVGEMLDDDKNKIWTMLTWNGAKVVDRLGPEVTHAIVNDTQDKVYTDGSAMPGIKFVTSDWVQISLKTNTRIDEKEYHPQLFQEEEPEASEEGQEDMDIDINAGKLLIYITRASRLHCCVHRT